MTHDNNLFIQILKYSLFSQKATFKLEENNINTILREAKNQAVFPLVFSVLEKEYNLQPYVTQYYSNISHNVKIVEEHKTLHKLLNKSNIIYVVLKGCASALFYPEPLLRTMGDVDLLVSKENLQKTVDILKLNGYEIIEDLNDIHITLKNKANNIVVELHHTINGIPSGAMGDDVSVLLSDIFTKAIFENEEYYRPCDFHHGLILLLHTAQHLTHEGIGLRHLCDWAVFVNSFTDTSFCDLFQKPLESIGLWKFAQVLTQFAVEYLGCSTKKCCGELDSAILEGLLNDVFNGGNFGKKESSRYQHIKYISDRVDDNTTKSPLKQLFNNIIIKAQREIGFVKKHTWLLPIGVICVAVKYLWLILTGKRRMDNKPLITEAFKRKELYNAFELFK